MLGRFSIVTVAIAGTALSVVMMACIAPAAAQATSAATPAQTKPLTTPWGDPDLQGIWTDETDVPLQRAPQFGNQEFFTDEQRAEIDRQRTNMQGRERRAERTPQTDKMRAQSGGPPSRRGAARDIQASPCRAVAA